MPKATTRLVKSWWMLGLFFAIGAQITDCAQATEGRDDRQGSAPPSHGSMKTGSWVALHDQLRDETLRRMSRQDKETLADRQLLELLPKSITEHVPMVVLKECNFSLSDSDYVRSQKYIRLALLVRGIGGNDIVTRRWRRSPDFMRPIVYDRKLQAQVMFKAFEQALGLASDIAEVPLYQQPDYLLSLGQITAWVVEARLQAGSEGFKELSQLYWKVKRATEYVNDAESALGNLPTELEYRQARVVLTKVVELNLGRLSDAELKKMAGDPTTAAALVTSDELEDQYNEYAVQGEAEASKRARKKLLAMPNPPQSLDKALSDFQALRYEQRRRHVAKIVQGMSRDEKIALLLKQRPEVNYERLVALDKVPAKLQEQISRDDYVNKAAIVDHYSGLVDDRQPVITKIVKAYEHKIEETRQTIAELNERIAVGLYRAKAGERVSVVEVDHEAIAAERKLAKEKARAALNAWKETQAQRKKLPDAA